MVPPTPTADQEAKRQSRRGEIYGSFLIDRSEFAIPVSAVQEVVNEPNEISPVPLAPEFMLGLFNLRGVILPVIDLRAYMGDGAAFQLGKTIPKERKMLVLETSHGPVGLMVYSADSILPYYEDEILPFANWQSLAGSLSKAS